ncbi:MAG: hypothetical protein JO067_08400 [Cupriavidus sp.]|nr:hypothetical protein [Cupriavidus sp.]
MARTIELFGWFVFNVAIPLVAPLALLPLAKLPYFFRKQSHGIVLRAIEGGQLLWAAIPMSAAACYLLAMTLDEATLNRQYMWMGIATHVFLIVFAAVLVLLGAMEASCAGTRPRNRPNWVLRVSIGLTIVSAGAYFGVYAEFVQPFVHPSAY